MYTVENRYQDSQWEYVAEFASFSDAVEHARTCSHDPISYGMTRVHDGKSVLVTFSAGG